MLVSDIFLAAMSKIGAINSGESLTTEENSLLLLNLNLLLGQWSGQGLMIRSNTLEGLTLTASVGTYTIGPGSSGTSKFVSTKPNKVLFAFLRDSDSSDTSVGIVERQEYLGIPDKTALGRPDRLWYDPGMTQQVYPSVGTLYLNPVPDSVSTYVLWLSSEKSLVEFSAATDTVTMEPIYFSALVYNLAVRIYRDFHKHQTAIPEDLVGLARDTKHTIHQLNSVQWHSAIELAGMNTGAYDINTGAA
jgi:hypothetical protein